MIEALMKFECLAFMTYEGRCAYMCAIGMVVIPICCEIGHRALHKRLFESIP